MVALITWVSILPNKMDQALEIITTSIMPRLEQIEGCLGLLMMVDRESRELASLSLWKDYRSLRTIELNGFADQQAAKLASVVTGAITGTPYEVVASAQLPSIFAGSFTRIDDPPTRQRSTCKE